MAVRPPCWRRALVVYTYYPKITIGFDKDSLQYGEETSGHLNYQGEFWA